MSRWFLARFPRPVVVSFIAFFDTLITIGLIVFAASALVAGVACLISFVMWTVLLTGGTLGDGYSMPALYLSCVGALAVPIGLFLYVTVNVLRSVDKEIPRREKKQ
jgi:hypothetical protein